MEYSSANHNNPQPSPHNAGVEPSRSSKAPDVPRPARAKLGPPPLRPGMAYSNAQQALEQPNATSVQ